MIVCELVQKLQRFDPSLRVVVLQGDKCALGHNGEFPWLSDPQIRLEEDNQLHGGTNDSPGNELVGETVVVL